MVDAHSDGVSDVAETHFKTGFVCPACKQPMAVIIRIGDGVLMMRCPACSNRWSASEPPKPEDDDSI